jgi:hypothetical protein
MSYPHSAIAHAKASITTIARRAPARQPRPSADWPAHALSAYYYAQRQALAALPKLLATLDRAGAQVRAVTLSRPSLDDVYLHHTGHRYVVEGVSTPAADTETVTKGARR